MGSYVCECVCVCCVCVCVCRSARVCTTALWILGEYSISQEEIQAAIDVIKQALGPTPFLNADGGWAHTRTHTLGLHVRATIREGSGVAIDTCCAVS